MELSFAVYQERQLHEVSPAGLAARSAKLTPAGRFRFHGRAWKPNPYVGHAVVTMAASAPANAPLIASGRSIQRVLMSEAAAPGALYPLPAESFHQTIATTLSDEKHQRLVVERGLAAQFPEIVTRAFADIPPASERGPVSMRMVGLSLFGTAIGLLGIFEHEEEFRRVLHFRDHFFGNARIAGLGIRRTRPFIGHITLAYVESVLDAAARTRIADVVAEINRTLSLCDQPFHLPAVELRAYDHLAEFKPLPGLPQCRL